MEIEVVKVFDKFVELEPEWKKLVEESCIDNPFVTYEFFYCLVKAFFENSELLIFVVKDSEEVVGIAPFLKDGNSIKSINNIHSHYFDFIIKKSNYNLYGQVFQYILSNYQFDSIFLGDICSRSDLFEYICSNDRFIYVIEYERPSPILMVTTNWKNFYSSISKNFRNNFNKRVNKVRRQGGYQLKECSNSDELDGFQSDLLDIEKKSWKHSLGRSILSTKGQPIFYSLLSKEFFENVKIDILYIDDSPAAFWLSLFYNNSVYQLKNSFVEDFKDVSPGIILTVECLKKYFKQNVKYIDYLGITNSVKSKVSNDYRVAYNVRLYRKNLANHVYVFFKFKVWPKVGNNNFAQSVKNFILRKTPQEKVSRSDFKKR